MKNIPEQEPVPFPLFTGFQATVRIQQIYQAMFVIGFTASFATGWVNGVHHKAWY